MSSRNAEPTKRASRLRTNAAPMPTALSEKRPAAMYGLVNHWIAGESIAEVSRSGASRKSSAFAVGGVSRMMRSYFFSPAMSYSLAIAAYSCEPASVDEICW